MSRPSSAHPSSPRSVLAFDHHCPWTASCIGFGNKKFFVQYLIINTLYCYFAAFMTAWKTFVYGPVLYGIGPNFTPCFDRLGLWPCMRQFSYDLARSDLSLSELAVLIVFVLGFAFGTGTLILGVYHIMLLMRNQTTVEDGIEPNEFDTGSRLENMRQVCGPSILAGCFSPMFTSEGDGTEWKLKKLE